MMPGAVRRSLGINFKTEENLGKPQIGNHLKKAVRPVIASNELSYFVMASVGSQSTLERENERKKERGNKSQGFTTWNSVKGEGKRKRASWK